MPVLVVATRSGHKLREISEILGDLPGWTVLDLDGAGVPESPAEEAIEAFDSFEENALAKASYFAARTGHLTLADDSGLCVDALGGAPGVRSKRFSARPDLAGPELDRANNDLLLTRLSGVPRERRGAHYVCVVAVAAPDGSERLFRGTCHGSILEAPRGQGGFGYDSLFLVPGENAAMAELSPGRKNQISHRAHAIRAARGFLLSVPENGDMGAG